MTAGIEDEGGSRYQSLGFRLSASDYLRI